MDDRFAHLRYVAVDGPIGVGKTTFCRILADRIGGHLVLEEADKNPFLKDFYHDRRRYALQTQFFFLLSRYAQQKELIEYDLFKKKIVADYTFEKDFLFAQSNLTEDELSLYKQVAELLKKNLPKPDLVVFLTASVEVLTARIKKRNITYERNFDAEYLTSVVEAYNHYFFHYNRTPLLVIKTDRLDFVENSTHLDEIFTQIAEMRQGTRYFTRGDEMLGL
ncbi:MAG: deoxynucleoside kinase [candidate division Zixibacteria bacterium]|nr:deoxynucleoside kinase [candidate division Zixibacteria bacterium]